ncbi:MAG: XRE family transcriptional regulator [Hyphomicrobiales bacterium]
MTDQTLSNREKKSGEAASALPTTPIQTGFADGAGIVGDDIRALRKHRNLTLANLADALGRSIGWLSQVERGQNDPSVQDLRKIAQFFEVPISFFFRNNDAPQSERGLIVRAEHRTALGSRESGLLEELLSPDISGDFEMLRSSFAPGAKSEDIAARPTQEGGFIVSGQLNVWIDGNQYVLKQGDSFQFQNVSYRWHNMGDEPAVVIWVISPPIY